MKHLITHALEDAQASTEQPSSAGVLDQLAQLDQPTPEQETVMMRGPLATIFSEALNIAYAKQSPISGVATESQSNDQMSRIAVLLSEQAAAGGDNEPVKVFSYSSITKNEERPEPVAVVRDVGKLSDKVPTTFIFYSDCTNNTDDAVVGGAEVKLLPVVESIEIVVKVRKAPQAK